jgi:hypothetical protein
MSFKSSLIMLLIVRQQEQSLRINTPIYFGQDGAMVLERLEAELLGDHIPGGDMPSPPTSSVPDASIFPLYSQRLLSRGGHSTAGCVLRALPSSTYSSFSSNTKSTGKETGSFSWQEEKL